MEQSRRAPRTGAARALVLVTVAAVLAACSSGSSSTPSSSTTTTTAPSTTHQSPSGVVSTAIVMENAKKGTTAWQITSEPPTGLLQGFANTTDATQGHSVTFYVSSTEPHFHLSAFRMGYYGGAGARRIWTSKRVAGHVQPACPLTAGINMVSCSNWSPSITVPITSSFVPGEYLFKLDAPSGLQSYVPLTISDPHSTAAYLLISRSLTEAGWNTYGGYSFYQGQGPCTLGNNPYPVCNRARVASLDRPFLDGHGSSDFLSNEYPLVRFCESRGLDVTYATDIRLSVQPGLMLHHRAVVSLGHDETWTYAERHGAVVAMHHGVNLAFLGAAAVLRHARLARSPLGPDRLVVNYRDSTEDPIAATGPATEVTGNTFLSPPTNLSPTSITGELYSGYMDPGSTPVPLVVWAPRSWLFKGTGLHRGSQIPGVIDSDIDHRDPSSLSPPSLQILAHSPVPANITYTNQGTWNGVTYADTTYWSTPRSKAGIFDAGTVNWIYAIQDCSSPSMCPAPMMNQLTANLFHLFGLGPAGRFSPSVPNTAGVTPAGT